MRQPKLNDYKINVKTYILVCTLIEYEKKGEDKNRGELQF